MIFDENIFPFTELHPNAGARLRSEILCLPSDLIHPYVGGEHAVDQCANGSSNSSNISSELHDENQEENQGEAGANSGEAGAGSGSESDPGAAMCQPPYATTSPVLSPVTVSDLDTASHQP